MASHLSAQATLILMGEGSGLSVSWMQFSIVLLQEVAYIGYRFLAYDL